MDSRESYDGAGAPAKLRAYPGWARLSVVAFSSAALLGLALLALAALLADDPPVTPPILLRAFAWTVALPALVAAGIARPFAAKAHLRDGQLVVERRSRRHEIPLAAIERVREWRLPLPSPGFALALRSGRRLGFGLALRDPAPLLRALANAGIAADSRDSALARFSRARAARPAPSLARRLGKFPGFALLPTALLFNVHQQISYGGLLGEYHLLGLSPYLTTLASYWSATTVFLLMLAAFLRAIAELVCLGASRVAPSRAQRTRRAAELACGVGYYAGVPLLLVLRFLP